MMRFQQGFRLHFLNKNKAERNRKALLFLTSIIDFNEPLDDRLKAIALSVDECRLIHSYQSLKQTQTDIFAESTVITPLDIHRFFKAGGSSGIDLVVMMLADYCSKIGSDFSMEGWLDLLERCRTLVEAWFTKPKLINPTPLIRGDEIINEFNLEEGPLIGRLLEQLVEKQVQGEIKSIGDAFAWLKNELRGEK